METVMSRVGRLLGLRLHGSARPVCAVPQSTESIPSSPNPAPVIQTKKKRKPRVKLSESINRVTELRKQGLTYQAIGYELKMSKQRVHQVLKAKKKRDLDKTLWTHGLSVRNKHLVEQLKINSVDDLRRNINEKEIRPFKYKNFGITSYTDLCKWANVDPVKFTQTKSCPHCGKSI